MKHIHGVSVRLTDHVGRTLIEAPKPSTTHNALLRFNGRVGSSSICTRSGVPFRIQIVLNDDFRIYSADGIKVAVVAYEFSPVSRKLRQRHQLFWIPVDRLNAGAEHKLPGFPQIEQSKSGFRSVLVPEPDADYETATASWVTQEFYCANKGCVAVFVERGRLCEALRDDVELQRASRAEYRANVEIGEPILIRADWFYPLNGPNGDPYVFEFRNMDANAFNSLASRGYREEHFGGDSDILVDSDSDNLRESSEDSASESEPEAQATDSDSSSSEAESTDLKSSCSESEDELPLPRKRKRPAARPKHSTSRKKARTIAEKNAEANATNATFANRDSDREDEEVLPPRWLKREKSVKLERAASVVPRNVPQRSSMGRAGGIVHLTPFRRS